MDGDRLRELIESSNLDDLVRFVDGAAASRDWDGLRTIRDRCREAVDRGKQLWGVAEYAEYRMALDAPAPVAIEVVTPGAGRFGNGPLWEVAASTHEWDDLAALADPALRALCAHERLVRGDDLAGVDIDRLVVDAPLQLHPWEPRYPVAVYRADRADFPERAPTPLEWLDLPSDPAPALRADGGVDALLELVRPWLEESSGRGEAVVVHGDAETAIRTLAGRIGCGLRTSR